MYKKFFSSLIIVILILSLMAPTSYGADSVPGEETPGTDPAPVVNPTPEKDTPVVTPNPTPDKKKEKKVKRLPAPKNIKAKVKTISNNIIITWKAVKGADGYKVYRYSKSKKKYVIQRTLSKNRRSYTHKKLRQKTRYRYKVCAYKKTDGKIVKGKFSKSASARTYKTYRARALAKPLKRLSTVSSYGWRWGRMHNGCDYRGSHGANIYAVADGKVIESHGTINTMGVTIKIRHSNGVVTTYGHLSKRMVKKGKRVRAGQKIGEVGATGNAMCSHLHFEVKIKGKRCNPNNFY